MSMIVVSDVTTLETRGKWQGILSVGVALGGAVVSAFIHLCILAIS